MAPATKKKPAKQTVAAAKDTAATAKSTGSAAKKTATSAAKTATSATKDTASAAKKTLTSAAKTARSATRETADAANRSLTTAAPRATSVTYTSSDHGQQAVQEAIAATKTVTPSGFLEAAAAKASEALKSLPTFDVTNFDFDSLKQLAPRNVDWSKLDVSKIEMPDLDRDKLLGAVRDAAYVMIGFGVLAFQQAQVSRRELAEAIGDRFGSNRTQMEELIASYEARLTKLDEAIEARVDHAVGMIGERLPEQAETLLLQVNSVAKTARKQMRGLLSNAA